MERLPLPEWSLTWAFLRLRGSGQEHPALTVLLCRSPMRELQSLACNAFT